VKFCKTKGSELEYTGLTAGKSVFLMTGLNELFASEWNE
jgi:hypothetical protein